MHAHAHAHMHMHMHTHTCTHAHCTLHIRLVMRASGSYRLMLNTHLWAEMKCARSSQKTIRITAQGSDDGLISVFVIMVSKAKKNY